MDCTSNWIVIHIDKKERKKKKKVFLGEEKDKSGFEKYYRCRGNGGLLPSMMDCELPISEKCDDIAP